MRTENTETDTKLEVITIQTCTGGERQHYMSQTERAIFEIITDFRFSVADKIKLVCHYQSELNFDVFNHFWDVALFSEHLKRKVQNQ